MVLWVVRAAQEAGADRIVTVIGNGADLVRRALSGESTGILWSKPSGLERPTPLSKPHRY
ncbi:MAG: hypothetical protein R2688_02820 [Fimbriimonadaceae bacterium]